MSERSTGDRRVRLPRDPMRLALFALMVFTVSRVHQHFGIGVIRPGLMLAGFATLYAFLNPRTMAEGTLKTWPAVAVIGMGVAACLSVPFGISMGSSAAYLLDNYSKVLIFGILLIISVRNASDVMFLVVGYVLACGLLAYTALTAFDLSRAATSHVARLGDMYSYDANDAGLVLVVGLPLCLLVLQTGGRYLKILSVVVLAASSWTIALTGSRGAFVSLGVVGLALLFSLKKVPLHRRMLSLGAVLVALVLAAPEGYWKQMSTILNPQDDYNMTADVGRVAIAKRGIGYMIDNPIFGVGLNNFNRAEGTISSMARNAMPGVGVPWLAPHNSYIQAAAELGIPGAVLFATLVFGGMVGMFRLRARMPSHWEHGSPEERFLYASTYYLFLSYLGFSVAALFLSFAYLDPIYILSAFSAGLYASARRRMRAMVPQQESAGLRNGDGGRRKAFLADGGD